VSALLLLLTLSANAWADGPSWRPQHDNTPPAQAAPQPDAVEDLDTAPPPPSDAERSLKPECQRSLGLSGGVILPTSVDWNLTGTGDLSLTGSPTFSMSCRTGGKNRLWMGLQTAPLQGHYYRNASRASLLVLPQVGVERGLGQWRYGAQFLFIPRLVGGGLKLGYRFSGDGFVKRNKHTGRPNGLEMRLNYLDGEAPQIQGALFFTFGLSPT